MAFDLLKNGNVLEKLIYKMPNKIVNHREFVAYVEHEILRQTLIGRKNTVLIEIPEEVPFTKKSKYLGLIEKQFTEKMNIKSALKPGEQRPAHPFITSNHYLLCRVVKLNEDPYVIIENAGNPFHGIPLAPCDKYNPFCNYIYIQF